MKWDRAGDVILTRETPRPDESAIKALRMRAAFTPPPVSSRLPFSYRAIPGALRSAAASLIGRWQRSRAHRWAAFPRWPIDLSVDFLSDLHAADASTSRRQPTPVILSHDLDSAEGLQNVVRDFLPLEEKVGARSTNFIVPRGWTLDHGLLDELTSRGHELGIHGYDHGNRTPFAQEAERRRRLEAARPLIERYAIRGYRAPSLLRSPELLNDLAKIYAYDSSIPTAGGLFPTPNNGCATARPFRIGELLEIPLSLPRDGSLKFLGYSPEEIGALWIRVADQISKSGGVVVLLTHGESRFSGNAAMLGAYRRFLEWVSASGKFQWTISGELTRQLEEGGKSQRAA
jgi:peptidoglycan/xylan/chitin deacetylase (PgdA/CDA1 family)